jgi:hypothetical protein
MLYPNRSEASLYKHEKIATAVIKNVTGSGIEPVNIEAIHLHGLLAKNALYLYTLKA